VRVVGEPHRRLVQAALTLDPDVRRAVDHDLRHGVVGEQPLERAVAEDVVRDLDDQPLAVVARDRGLGAEPAADVRDDPVAQLVLVQALLEDLRPQVRDHLHVHRVLEVGERLLLLAHLLALVRAQPLV
jgi:hypothetical protein